MNEVLTDLSDDDLLGRVREGDPRAFEALYRRHQPDVLAYLRRRCENTEMAEDAVADAFFKTLRAISNGHGPVDGFRPYIFTAARRVAQQMTGATSAHWSGFDEDHVETIVDDDPWEERVGPMDSPIVEALRRLSPRSRQILWLLEVEGWRPAEVAGAMGLSANAVSALAYRSRQRLREHYVALMGEAAAARVADAPTWSGVG